MEKAYKLEIDIHAVEEDYTDAEYRMFINDELIVDRPYNIPPQYHFQRLHIHCKLSEGPNTIAIDPTNCKLKLGKINIDNKQIQHTNGYFEL